MESIIWLIVCIHITLALVVVFRDTRDVSSTWAWLIVLIFLPVAGLIIYLFFGKKISKDNIFDLKNQERLGLKISSDEQQELLKNGSLGSKHNRSEHEMISLFLNSEDALYTQYNTVDIIIDGTKKFNALIQDIQQAKHHIHLQYYIFHSDDLGKRVVRELAEKAKQGVEVLVLYDAWGNNTLKPNFFKKLTKAGGKAMPFFGSPIPIINLRMNYRNHRKIVVIDGKIGYIGGFNIGDEYIGLGKLGYWRDTHLRIQGEAVHSLQTRFFVDWNATAAEKDQRSYQMAYFPEVKHLSLNGEHVAMQIVSSGPDEDWEHIKLGYVKMISLAKESIYIQTPYFIPDESVMDALRIAIRSGIQVYIMIPDRPDHMVVYRATEYYAKILQSLGANVYLYEKGFIHSKVVIIDSQISSVGTANFDYRSFRLNFEVSAFLYNETIAKELESYFWIDVSHSLKADENYFKQQSKWRKCKQAIARLFSPIL
ncbi:MULTISPECIES: cardiolipin synthase [unclassified Granulicatella]|uniref:cardiolipin synthase n=1 Tax=unclassified Granulicatella TaxID=2630493 RepID=UPI001074584F|nr:MULTISPECIES: cardiolipin synthase [unclassified Granulicatella]MBF0780686.1 cardiolipin synthase [Granulicatella sp. 19428wC4_WM01]TFU94228.1 cardiolipin synthase [Granulicatella sp. WM01]